MLGICLKILSILGLILLILLALLFAGILLVLFFPFSYRLWGIKDGEGVRLKARMRWLWGLLRVSSDYPDPGRLKVRFLFFTVYDQALLPHKEEEGAGADGTPRKKSEKKRKKKKHHQKNHNKKRRQQTEGKSKREDGQNAEERSGGESRQNAEERSGGESRQNAEERSEKENRQNPEERSEKENRQNTEERSDREDRQNAEGRPEEDCRQTPAEISEKEGKASLREKIFSKIEKIKYTIRNRYDKIKKIWKNISHYIDLLREEEMKILLSDSLTALKKIIKSIRPRHIRADIRFGTGAPDTTGYIYGIYCMLSSSWKPGFLVTPDFEEAVLQGEFDVSGRISVWILLLNGLKMYKLIRKLAAAKETSV